MMASSILRIALQANRALPEVDFIKVLHIAGKVQRAVKEDS